MDLDLIAIRIHVYMYMYMFIYVDIREPFLFPWIRVPVSISDNLYVLSF